MILGRVLRFQGVGVLGLAVHLSVVQTAVACSIHGASASLLGVLAALVHNFLWHRLWTWRDRRETDRPAAQTFARFVAANGVVSMCGSALIVPTLLAATTIQPVAASAVAIAASGIVNYLLAERFVFARLPERRAPAAAIIVRVFTADSGRCDPRGRARRRSLPALQPGRVHGLHERGAAAAAVHDERRH